MPTRSRWLTLLAAAGALGSSCWTSHKTQSTLSSTETEIPVMPESTCVEGVARLTNVVCAGDNCRSVVEVSTTLGDTVVVTLPKEFCGCLPGTGNVPALSLSMRPRIHVCFVRNGRSRGGYAYWCELECVKMPSNSVLQPSAPREGLR